MIAGAPRAVAGRTGEWLEDPGFGVYVHIPFCVHRCHYCDFNTYEGLESIRAPYVDAVVRHIEVSDEARPVTSVFFGGGTPTILEPSQLGRILEAIERRFGIADDAEITIEANPETVDDAKFGALRHVGFNRVSIGVQSLVDHVLVGLGRTHSAAVAVEAVGAARRAGFDDINVDVIYGSPWESESDWATTLEAVVSLDADHISAYALTIEEATPLATLIRTGRVPDVDPDVQAHRHGVAESALSAAGYERYEISNWARPGRASRHNVLYWSSGNYLGFGAGAHGHRDGRRWWNVRLPRDYVASISASGSAIDGEELLEGGSRGGEALMLGLRLRSGVPIEAFTRRFGRAVIETRSAAIADLAVSGLIVDNAGNLALTDRATLVANEVAARLL
ncbi:MAG: radical SAM family heme chaperone HemW [Actinomycetota bacterium]|nr:radical SAM family heme chaperone HemW [Actinomycetota bacterium]